MIDKYPLKNKLVLINAGKMQQKISCFEAVIQAGGNPILLVSDIDKFSEEIREIDKQYSSNTFVSSIDITSQQDIDGLKNKIYSRFGTYPNILINNSTIEFDYNDLDNNSNMMLDEMMIEKWDKIVQEELTSILMLVKNFGNEMARSKGGVILNILSDLYLNPRGNIVGLMQNVKDISLIALTNGLVGLTKYISTYWNERCVRSNSLTIGASEENSFLETHREDLLNQIPIGRFANNDEFKAAVIFLVSDASSYLTGENIVINGGRTCW